MQCYVIREVRSLPLKMEKIRPVQILLQPWPQESHAGAILSPHWPSKRRLCFS